MSKTADWVTPPRAVLLVVALMLSAALYNSLADPAGGIGRDHGLPLTGASGGCRGTDAQVADPTAPHGMFILDPPTGTPGGNAKAVAQYLMNSTVACGA